MFSWDYDRGEILADGAVHAAGVASATIAVAALMVMAIPTTDTWEYVSAMAYGTGLMAVMITSALYNLWPVSPAKWMLRRFDHSAIFLLIAGTYTPFLAQSYSGAASTAFMAGMWATAAGGVALKMLLPGRFDRLSILIYLLMSWSGVFAFDHVFGSLPGTSIRLLAIGGILYTVGVVFHLWEGLRFQNAIWHSFVLAAAGCHYGAVLDCLVLART